MLTLKIERANGAVELYDSTSINFDKISGIYGVAGSPLSPILNEGDKSFVTNESGKTVFSWGNSHVSGQSLSSEFIGDVEKVVINNIKSHGKILRAMNSHLKPAHDLR